MTLRELITELQKLEQDINDPDVQVFTGAPGGYLTFPPGPYEQGEYAKFGSVYHRFDFLNTQQKKDAYDRKVKGVVIP